MDSRYKIAVLGIGGVGGYLGALLSSASLHSEVDVVFISRGENFEAIKSRGIKLITDVEETIYMTREITNQPWSGRKIDLLLCCVKNFDLQASLMSLSTSITDQTVILPFLNGIDVSEKITTLFPKATVWKGLIYLIARLVAPGVIKQTGPLNQIFFGCNSQLDPRLDYVAKLLQKAGINAHAADDIDSKLWEKYFFISTMATITSYYNCNIGEIKMDAVRLVDLKYMLNELNTVATASGIVTQPNISEITFLKIYNLPPESTSSMLNDFRKGGKTELEELTGFVVKLGEKFRLSTVTYARMYHSLKQRADSV